MEKITDTITYVGCDDSDLDLFESQYKVPNGMAYNSYLVQDGKNILFDTVDRRKEEEWKENVLKALNGEELDYLVIQHLEPDHSSGIDWVLQKFPKAKLIASAKAISMLPNFVDSPTEGRTIAVKDKETLKLGNVDFTFINAPMVHWPEVIMTYDAKDKILFSADAFGKFGTRDADEPWDDESRRYYLNIVGKYGPQVQAVLKKAAGLDIEKVLSLHGPFLNKEDLPHVLDLYSLWSTYTPETEGVLILVASIHGHTNVAAEKMKEILEAKGQKVHLMDVTRSDTHECVAQAFRYPKIVLMACSYDAGLFPPMERVLMILSHKNFQKRVIGMVQNGSWAPSAAKTMKAILEPCKNLTFVEPVVTITTSLREANIPAMEELADHLIEA